MKNFKKLYLGMLFTVLVRIGFSQTISNHFFGQNAWMPDTIGNVVYYGKLHQQWGNIQSSNTSIVRFGGIAPDQHMPTNFQYVRMIDSIRAKGMEPVIQVPFNNWAYTANQAAAIVTYINVTKAKHVKYWIIGNEPNLGYSYTTASQIANFIRPFATAMKNVDPSILIVGPEIAWFDYTIMDGLTNPGGPDDITGKDANGRYYIDVVSFHTYPFSGSQNRASVISNLTEPYKFQDNLIHLNQRVTACNTFHTRTGTAALKTAVTEANIDYQNPAGDNLGGVGASSFLGGQFLAEMFGIGLKNGVDFMNIWSVVEGNTAASNIGYIDGSTNTKKPLYYHFKLMAENFKGTYANATTTVANVKSFGSKDGQHVYVIVMNEDLTNNYPYTVRLNTAAASGTNALKINVNANIATEYTDVLTNQSTVLLTFDLAGNLTKKCVYGLASHAVSNLAPTCTDYNTIAGLAPVANFSATTTQICGSGSTTFTDLSTNTPTSRTWTFTGGTPATSTASNPVVSYSVAGTYAVTLTSTNSTGSNTKTTSGYITVSAGPTTPSVISGIKTGLCVAGVSSTTYSVPAVVNATSYTWTAPTGTTITAGQGTRIITLTIGSNFSFGNLTVKANSSCGSSALRIATLHSIVSSPYAITGLTSGLAGHTNVTYTVPAVSGASSYTWTTPVGVTLVSGQGTRTIIVNFATNFVSGNLLVKSNNGCGSSASRLLALSGTGILKDLVADSTTTAPVVNEAMLSDYEINLFPNPSDGNFSISMTQNNAQGSNYKVEVVNELGQEVYKSNASFSSGREEISLTDKLTNGVYFVRVGKSDDKTMTTKRMVINK